MRHLASLATPFVAFLLFTTSSVTSAQNRTTTGTEPLTAQGTVVVDNHEGRITVETWDRNEVKYRAVVQPEAGADHPEATTVTVDKTPDRITLQTAYDDENEDSGFWDWGTGQNIMPVAYTLTVPRTASVDIDDHESDVRMNEVEGPVTIDTHDGSVRLTGTRGTAAIDSHDGPIRIMEQGGDLQIDTHDSNIRLREVQAHVEIDAHDSEIDARGLRGGLRVETHGGRGRMTFAAVTDPIDIETHDGHFTLALPPVADFDLRTDFDDDADLRADFDLGPYRIDSDDDDEVNYSGRVRGGGPRLSLTAHDGSFEIRNK